MSRFSPEKIKVVIWDLDDTFWEGTVSEETISIPDRHIQLLKDLTDMGIVNSICSKNDFYEVEKKLKEYQLWEYFVFPSITWGAKGERIYSVLKQMNLRASNALFIDDNALNLSEVAYYNPEIMCSSPEVIDELIIWASKQEKKDLAHNRLRNYQVLQEKQKAKETMGSNEEFLQQSEICVAINRECEPYVERIYELIHRTNQLNYTKQRITKETLQMILKHSDYDCGFVQAKDKYGDYGIVGFFAKREKRLEHFLFSCRTLGMGIEQFVYAELGFPLIEVVGSVATQLVQNECPHWISKVENIEQNSDREEDNVNCRILMKGPCDMMQLFSFIKDEESNIDWEFTYVGEKGTSIEQHNHTSCIVEAYYLNKEQKEKLTYELPFGDKDMFSTKIYDESYDIVFLSMLTDGGLGLYKRKESGEIIAFGQYLYPLTEEKYWESFINGDLPVSECKFTKAMLEDFKEKYDFIGRVSEEQIVDNIRFIRKHLDKKTLLVLLLGVEIPYNDNKLKNYEDRHLFNCKLNAQLRELVRENKQIILIEFGDYVKKQTDFYNNINHFIKPIYYQVAKRMIEIVNSNTSTKLKNSNLIRSYLAYARQLLRKISRQDKFNR